MEPGHVESGHVEFGAGGGLLPRHVEIEGADHLWFLPCPAHANCFAQAKAHTDSNVTSCFHANLSNVTASARHDWTPRAQDTITHDTIADDSNALSHDAVPDVPDADSVTFSSDAGPSSTTPSPTLPLP